MTDNNDGNRESDETIDVSAGEPQPQDKTKPSSSPVDTPSGGKYRSFEDAAQPVEEGDYIENDVKGEGTIKIPARLYQKHPEKISLEELEADDVPDKLREDMLNTYPHLQEELQERNERIEGQSTDGGENPSEDNPTTSETTQNQPDPEPEADQSTSMSSEPHHELETESDNVNIDTIKRRITGRSDITPTVQQVKDAYMNDELSDAEMEAAKEVAVIEEDTESEPEVSQSEPVNTEDTTPSPEMNPEPEPDTEPTRSDTGILDEDNNYPWEGAAVSEASQVGERVEHKFTFKNTPFEVTEPEQMDDLDRPLRQLQNIQEIDERKQKKKLKRFRREFADECLTIKGTPHYDVYIVETDKGRDIVPDPDGEYGLESDGRATPVWAAMTPFDKFKIGQRMSEEVLGERKFQDRYD